MPFSISCKSIPLLLFIVQTCANELNVLELGTQVDSILSQDINLPTFDGSTATFEDIADGALQQHDQHPSNLNPLLDCAASSSNIIQSPTGRKMRRMRYKRGGGGDGGAVCQWQEFREDGPETTTIPEDERLRGKRRRPKPSPGRDPGPIGPINNPEQPNNLEPAPYKLDRKADPQKCPFGQQNIPVCYPKVAIPQNNPALMLSPCRTDELADPCALDLEDLWCCREIYTRVLPNPALIPPNMRLRIMGYNQRYPNSASFCIGVLNPPNPPYPIWLWP